MGNESRTIAIGDIHGCSRAFEVLVEAIEPTAEDRLVVLGDFIDRGPNSRQVIEQLIELERSCDLVLLLGNHEEMLLSALENPESDILYHWLQCGGAATMDSYGFETRLHDIPAEHLGLLKRCVPYFETEKHAFLHANYDPNLPFQEQSTNHLRWKSLRDRIPERHVSGKTVIVGHTPQDDGVILDRGYLICIDTRCYADGWLTALDVDRGKLWQTNESGELRNPPGSSS
jgi:serine/threonine protein phosphatase 1